MQWSEEKDFDDSPLDVVTIGGMTLDLIVQRSQSKIITIDEPSYCQKFLSFEYGSKIYVDNIDRYPGGGANNTAVAFGRLGLKSGIASCVGDDEESEYLLQNLKKNGVTDDLVVQLERERTGLSVILTSYEHDRTVFSFRGVNNRLQREMVNWQKMQRAQWLYLPSLSGQSHELLPDVIQFAGQYGSKLACNPGNTQLALGMEGLADLFKVCDIFVCNKEEAEKLTGFCAFHKPIPENYNVIPAMKGEPWISDLRPLLEIIYQAGVKIVVITEGLKGAQLYDGQSCWWMPVYPYFPLDSLGAGDAFASSLVAATILGKSMEQALAFAAANASLTVQAYGAQTMLGTVEQVEALMAQHPEFVPQELK